MAADKQAVYARFLLSWCYSEEAGKVDAQLRRSGGNPRRRPPDPRRCVVSYAGRHGRALSRNIRPHLPAVRTSPKLRERLAEAQMGCRGPGGGKPKMQKPPCNSTHTVFRRGRRWPGSPWNKAGTLTHCRNSPSWLAEQDPHDQGTQISLATTLSQLDKPAEALAHLQPVIDSGYPDQKGNLHSLLGALLRKTGHPRRGGKSVCCRTPIVQRAYQQSTHRDQD